MNPLSVVQVGTYFLEVGDILKSPREITPAEKHKLMAAYELMELVDIPGNNGYLSEERFKQLSEAISKHMCALENTVCTGMVSVESSKSAHFYSHIGRAYFGLAEIINEHHQSPNS